MSEKGRSQESGFGGAGAEAGRKDGKEKRRGRPKAEKAGLGLAAILAGFGVAEAGCATAQSAGGLHVDKNVEMSDRAFEYIDEHLPDTEKIMSQAGTIRVWKVKVEGQKETVGAAFIFAKYDRSQSKLKEVKVSRAESSAADINNATFVGIGKIAEHLRTIDTKNETWNSADPDPRNTVRTMVQGEYLSAGELENVAYIPEDDQVETISGKARVVGKFNAIFVAELSEIISDPPEIPLSLASVWAAEVAQGDPTAKGNILIDEDGNKIKVTFQVAGQQVNPRFRGEVAFTFTEGDIAEADKKFRATVAQLTKKGEVKGVDSDSASGGSDKTKKDKKFDKAGVEIGSTAIEFRFNTTEFDNDPLIEQIVKSFLKNLSDDSQYNITNGKCVIGYASGSTLKASIRLEFTTGDDVPVKAEEEFEISKEVPDETGIALINQVENLPDAAREFNLTAAIERLKGKIETNVQEFRNRRQSIPQSTQP